MPTRIGCDGRSCASQAVDIVPAASVYRDLIGLDFRCWLRKGRLPEAVSAWAGGRGAGVSVWGGAYARTLQGEPNRRRMLCTASPTGSAPRAPDHLRRWPRRFVPQPDRALDTMPRNLPEFSRYETDNQTSRGRSSRIALARLSRGVLGPRLTGAQPASKSDN